MGGWTSVEALERQCLPSTQTVVHSCKEPDIGDQIKSGLSSPLLARDAIFADMSLRRSPCLAANSVEWILETMPKLILIRPRGRTETIQITEKLSYQFLEH